MAKKLYKSDKDKVLSGVIGGVGEYFDIDPTILRLAFIVFVVLTGVFPGVVAYIIAALIVPNTPTLQDFKYTEHTTETK
jgi:phage shock protein C